MMDAAAEEQTLVEAARRAMELAYAPYSHFPVGAAILTGDGRMFVGANIENASYPLALCAERAAVAAALAGGSRDLRMIAVASGGEPPATPCGACRQVLAEFNLSMLVLVAPQKPGGDIQRYVLGALLPHAFTPESLIHD